MEEKKTSWVAESMQIVWEYPKISALIQMLQLRNYLFPVIFLQIFGHFKDLKQWAEFEIKALSRAFKSLSKTLPSQKFATKLHERQLLCFRIKSKESSYDFTVALFLSCVWICIRVSPQFWYCHTCCLIIFCPLGKRFCVTETENTVLSL